MAAKITADARRDAREWGRYRAQELVAEMRSLALDHAAQWDADPHTYLETALAALSKGIRDARSPQPASHR